MTLPPLPELKPCPFCGSTNISTDDARDFVACMDCHTEGPVNIGMGSNYAGEAWNRRAAIAAHVPEAAFGNIAAVPGATREGCNYLSAPGRICNKCGHDHAAVPAQPFAPDWVTYRQGVADGAAQSVPVPAGWVPMHERAPDPDTECVVILRYSLDRPPFTAIDTWAMQREDPTGMGGPTMETGYGWNDNFDSDVIAWMPVLPHPPADWDQRLAMLAAAPKEQPHE